MGKHDERDQNIVEDYRAGKPIADIATEYDLTTERIRQIVRKAEKAQAAQSGPLP